jgi:hypothetical protein
MAIFSSCHAGGWRIGNNGMLSAGGSVLAAVYLGIMKWLKS